MCEQKGTLSAIRGCLGFVPQNDVMITTLSVRDVLLHAARTRMPREVPDAQKIERVDQVMDALSLTHIQNSIIGDAESGQRGISGGERKRVSIGIELVAQPSVLLLDEPTTVRVCLVSCLFARALRGSYSFDVSGPGLHHRRRCHSAAQTHRPDPARERGGCAPSTAVCAAGRGDSFRLLCIWGLTSVCDLAPLAET
jgi:hypothetical protein